MDGGRRIPPRIRGAWRVFKGGGGGGVPDGEPPAVCEVLPARQKQRRLGRGADSDRRRGRGIAHVLANVSQVIAGASPCVFYSGVENT